MLKKISYLLAVFTMVSLLWGCHGHNHGHDSTHHEDHDHGHDNDHDSDGHNGFNQKLADKLGADEYGMDTYVMAFLKEGPNRSQDSTTAAAMQRAHLDNINRLSEEGILVMAGPFFGAGPIRGIYIFDVETIEEAEALTKTDPMIQEGRLVMELKRWYGSAALKQMTELHNRIAKKNI